MKTFDSWIATTTLVLGLLIPAQALDAQVLNAPSRLTSERAPGVYEQLLIKNRGRYFGGQVSPSGELYLYLDDSQLQSAGLTGDAGELSPTLTDTDGVRKVSLAVVSRVPQTLRTDRRRGRELEIGVLHLPEERSRRRPIEVESVIELARLRVHGSGGARAQDVLDDDESFLGGGGR
ncbi:MAG: hypothetical protein GY719_06335 [bacterium]|nr:hypothetical protein [bacterium]